MLKNDARKILMALAADGLDYSTLTAKGRQEIRDAIGILIALPNESRTMHDYVESLDVKHEAVCAELHRTQAALATAKELIAKYKEHLDKLDGILT